MSTFHTTGIVLEVADIGEGDRRVSVYTEELGKLELFAKSARKISSKLSPHIEPLTIAECYVARGRIDHLAGIERRVRFSFGESLERLTHALWGAELVQRLTKPEHPESHIFTLLASWLAYVDHVSSPRLPPSGRCLFLLKLLLYLGYRQEFDHCLRCHTKEGETWYFSAPSGGLTCADCAHESYDLTLASLERRALLEACGAAHVFPTNLRSDFSQRIAEQMIEVLTNFHLERPLATVQFLRAIEGIPA